MRARAQNGGINVTEACKSARGVIKKQRVPRVFASLTAAAAPLITIDRSLFANPLERALSSPHYLRRGGYPVK